MNISILGSGTVGQTIGAKLAALGHDVMLGSRDPSKLADWQRGAGAHTYIGTFAETAAHGELVVNATSGMASLAALEAAGADALSGKILIDIANPLDFSNGFPPSLAVVNTDSLGEQIQRAFPETKVVKALNTLTADLMVDPGRLAGGDHHLFICGNDAEAKAQVTTFLQEWFGWRHILDLGEISAARGTEMVLPLWLRLMGTLGTPVFNFKIVQ